MLLAAASVKRGFECAKMRFAHIKVASGKVITLAKSKTCHSAHVRHKNYLSLVQLGLDFFF